MNSIQFDFSEAIFFVFAVIPIAFGFYFLHNFRKDRLKAFADPSVLNRVAILRLNGVFFVKICLFCIAWIFGVVALMQPKGNVRYVANGQASKIEPQLTTGEMKQKHHLIFFLLDLSQSMSIKDSTGGLSRLSEAKEIADTVISELQGESVALFGFTSATMQIVPLTMDYLFTRLMLQQAGINEGETVGTDIKGALEAIKETSFAASKDANKTLLLLTDGGDTSLFDLSGEKLMDAILEIVKPLGDAKKVHLRTLVVGTGSLVPSDVPGVTFKGKPVLSKVEAPLLKKLSQVGDGHLWLTSEMPAFEISREIIQSIREDTSYVTSQRETKEANDEAEVYDLYYQYPLGIAIFAIASCFLLPNTARKKNVLSASLIFAMSFAWPISADISQDLRFSFTYYDAENYGEAAAEYRGLYSESLSPLEQATLLYDAGTAFLAEGQYEKALSQFQEAISLDVPHPLLTRNLLVNEAIARLLYAKAKSSEFYGKENLEDYGAAFALFQDSLTAIALAEHAACSLEVAEGAKECGSMKDIDEIRLIAKKETADFLKNFLDFRSKNISLQKKGSLERLLTDYQLLLISEPLELASLDAVIESESLVETHLKSSSTQVREHYAQSQKLLNLSQKALKDSKFSTARFLILGAYLYTNKIVELLSSADNMSASAVLKSVIRQQEIAVLMARLFASVEAESGDLKTVMNKMQEETLLSAGGFIAAALKEQRKAFARGGAESCQCEPWDSVIPLFNKGYAKAAGAVLQSDIRRRILLQEGALKEWREALEKMKAKKMRPKPKANKQQEAAPAEETGGTKEVEKKNALNNIVKFVQAMESDDRSEPQVVIFRGKGEDRPW